MADQEQSGTEQTKCRHSNRLTLAQHLAAADWLKTRVEEAARVPKKQLVEALGDYLGHKVSVKNLEYIAEAAGVKLHSAMPEVKALFLRLAELEKRVQAMERQQALQPALAGLVLTAGAGQ